MKIELSAEELGELRDALYFCHNSLRLVSVPLFAKMDDAATEAEKDAPDLKGVAKMTCPHCNNTGYRQTTRIICGCLTREERKRTMFIVRDGYPPVAFKDSRLQELFDAAGDEFKDPKAAPSMSRVYALLNAESVVDDERDNLVTVTLTRQDVETMLEFAEACQYELCIGLPDQLKKALGTAKITPETQNQG